MKLREKRRHFESSGDDALAEIRNGFGDNANAALVFGRKKKRAKEWAMDAIAEREFRVAQAREKFGGEIRILSKNGPKQGVPVFGRTGCGCRSMRGSAHYLLFVPADFGANFAVAAAGAVPDGD